MKLRWYTKVENYWKWDDREECYCKASYSTKPVLQQEDDEGNWVNVPSFVETVSETYPK